MIDDDLDENNHDETIQSYAHKKREGAGVIGIIKSLLVIILVVLGVIFYLRFL